MITFLISLLFTVLCTYCLVSLPKCGYHNKQKDIAVMLRANKTLKYNQTTTNNKKTNNKTKMANWKAT